MTAISTIVAATKIRGKILFSDRNYFSEVVCITTSNAHRHQTAESACDISGDFSSHNILH